MARRLTTRCAALAWAIALWLTPLWALAQTLDAGAEPRTLTGRPPLTTGGRLLFWLGALVVMGLVARVVFREQLLERRTLKRLMDEIGPFFPEFDIDAVKRWVERCAPHVWSGWRGRDLTSLEGFATARFFEEAEARFEDQRRRGLEHAARLEAVLRVHPLAMYPVGDGQPPRDVELLLRLEEKAVDCLVRPDGAVVEGSTDVRQVQHFWALRHDGHRWRLDRVWRPERGVDLDLTDKPVLPPVAGWRRPQDRPAREGARRSDCDGRGARLT